MSIILITPAAICNRFTCLSIASNLSAPSALTEMFMRRPNLEKEMAVLEELKKTCYLLSLKCLPYIWRPQADLLCSNRVCPVHGGAVLEK